MSENDNDSQNTKLSGIFIGTTPMYIYKPNIEVVPKSGVSAILMR
jgi:hypothetical protein